MFKNLLVDLPASGIARLSDEHPGALVVDKSLSPGDMNLAVGVSDGFLGSWRRIEKTASDDDAFRLIGFNPF